MTSPPLSRNSLLFSLLAVVMLTANWLVLPKPRSDSPTAPLTPHPITLKPVPSTPLLPNTPDALTGENAKEELRKSGQYESLGEALAEARHAVEKIDPAGPHSRGAEYYASNPGQQLRAWFSNDGVELASGIPTPEGEEAWRLTLRLMAVGRGDSVTAVAPGSATGEGRRVEIEHPGAAVIQWFENRREGLEQGFTLCKAPEGGNGEVVIMLFNDGNLHAETAENEETLRFVDGGAVDVLHYTGLKAWDAAGRTLPARMEIRGPCEIALVVADAGALYPVTIDPLFANLESRLAEESLLGAEFGTSISLSGETALIGAPFASTPRAATAGSAYIFVNNGTSWRKHATLTAEDAMGGECFGGSVALSAGTVLVGAPGVPPSNQLWPFCFWDPTFYPCGSVYVFVRSDTTWSQEAKLMNPNQGAGADGFGYSVALDADTALVGAPRGGLHADPGQLGSAYVFVRSDALWTQQGLLHPPIIPNWGVGLANYFGYSVALAGDTALVGSPILNWDNGTPQPGTVGVFERVGSNWGQRDALWAEKPQAPYDQQHLSRYFGCSVALWEDTAIVGNPRYLSPYGRAPGVDDGPGSAYVFVKGPSLWTQQTELRASDREWGNGASFGMAVALTNDTVLIGDPYDTDDTAIVPGSAYVFVRNNDVWSEQDKLKSLDKLNSERFGFSVALSNGIALVGVPGADRSGVDAGSACEFRYQGGSFWLQGEDLPVGNGAASDWFGTSLALSGDTVLVGAPEDDTVAGVLAGAVYVFVQDDDLWTEQARLTATDGGDFSRLGSCVALSGNTALVGAPSDSTAEHKYAGSAHVFVRLGAAWTEQIKLTADDAADWDAFGDSVALSGDTALVGAPFDDIDADADAGSAYVFLRTESSWTLDRKLFSDHPNPDDHFGGAVALDGDICLLGAPDTDTVAGQDAGSAYVFVRRAGVWSQGEILGSEDSAAGCGMGRAVALFGDTALIGSPGDGMSAPNAGSAYLFERIGTASVRQTKLVANDAAEGDVFGRAVALFGGTALIGAPGCDAGSRRDVGSAYVFIRNGPGWEQQAKLNSGLDMSPSDGFGSDVALCGNTAVVGAPYDDTVSLDSGSAYVFLLGWLPEITTQPQSRVVVPGQSVSFNATVAGYAPLSYQWRRNGEVIDGAVGVIDVLGGEGSVISHTIASAQVSDQGDYDCVVSNIGGIATSAPAVLTVSPLSQYDQAFPGMASESQGVAIVTIAPSGIGGAWRFVGEQEWHQPGTAAQGLTTGDRVVEFRPATGYIHPAPEPITVISGGTVTILHRIYQPSTILGNGGVNVTLKPEALADPGLPVERRSQWRLLGEDDTQWRNSGTVEPDLVPGTYLIEPKSVEGRTTPLAVSVLVEDGLTASVTLTYYLAGTSIGVAPVTVPFETVTTSQDLPYGYVGQIRSAIGSGSGFVVKRRVVATAGHVVFDDGTLSAASGVEWLLQRDRGSYDPLPQLARGHVLMDGYAAQRISEATPGSATPASQEFDVAALWFNEGVGRGGYSGFLASDTEVNEWLVSDVQKTLVGYPVAGIAADKIGRMHASPLMNVEFAPAGSAHTYATTDIHSSRGASGGPLCVQFEGGSYYPAAIYIGGTNQTIVRSFDSAVVELFNEAEYRSFGGDNAVGGGITHSSYNTIQSTVGALQVLIEPQAASDAGGWRRSTDTFMRHPGTQLGSLAAGDYRIQFETVAGFLPPAPQTVKILKGELLTITFTYATENGDDDGDGFSNIDEYVAGTDPNNPGDFLRAMAGGKTGSSFSVTTSGKAGRVYEMQITVDLAGGEWTTVDTAGPLTEDATVTLTDDAAPPGSAFYRIRVTKP